MAATDDRLSRGTLLALVAMGFGVFLIANDFTALSVALPVIERDFDADVSTVQWVINGYALVFGVLIITGGRLADMFGRRRLFFIGAAIFAVFSAVAAIAPTIGVLLAARALMAVGGAIMWPAVLGMTFAALPKAKQGLAGGLILGVAGIGNAFGPLLGGILTDAASWRWVFVINIPVALFAVFITWREIHQPREKSDDRLDPAGMVLLSLALVALLLALDFAPEDGWGDTKVVALLIVSVAAFAVFPFAERRAGPNALVPGDVMRNPVFRWACIAVLCFSPCFFAALLYLPQFFQKVLGYSPLGAGLALLPMMLTFAAVSFVSGNLYNRLGPRPVISVGAVAFFAGILLLALIPEDAGYGWSVPGMVVLGVGVGLFLGAITSAAVTALPDARSSLAGAIIYMFQVGGGSVGLGLTTTVFATVSANHIADRAAGVPDGVIHAAHGILAGTESAQAAAAQLPFAADRIVEVVRDAFMAGMQAGFAVDAALALAGLLIATLVLGPRLRGRAATDAERARSTP